MWITILHPVFIQNKHLVLGSCAIKFGKWFLFPRRQRAPNPSSLWLLKGVARAGLAWLAVAAPLLGVGAHLGWVVHGGIVARPVCPKILFSRLI